MKKLKPSERKLALLKTLEYELRESIAEADRDWEEGNPVFIRTV